MRIGVVIEVMAGAANTWPGRIADRLADDETLVVTMEQPDGPRLRSLVRADGLQGLVIACTDTRAVRRRAAEALQEAGANRFAVEVVPLPLFLGARGEVDAQRARLMLASAAAKVRAHREAFDANLRLRFAGSVRQLNRRALLTPRSLGYEVVPAVDRSRCFAVRGCRLCLAACPAGAVSIERGAAQIEKGRCRDCRACVPACPARAIEHPLDHDGAVDAALRALLADAEQSRSVVAFGCQSALDGLADAARRARGLPAPLLPLPIPIRGAVGWRPIFLAVALGAEGVALLGCPSGGDSSCCDGAGKTEYEAMLRVFDGLLVAADRLLDLTGASPDCVVSELDRFAERLAAVPPLPRGLGSSEIPAKSTLAELLAVLVRRAESAGSFWLEDDALPVGQMAVAQDECSLCGICAGSCPSLALSWDESTGGARLIFDAVRCVACGLCVEACPEGALTLRHRLEVTAPAATRMLCSSEMANCPGCGEAFAPQALVTRVYRRLGRSLPSEAPLYCPGCRLLADVPADLAPQAAANRL